MAYFKTNLHLITVVGLISFGIAVPAFTHAQMDLPPNALSSLLPNQWEFRPPDNLDKPNNREGGATRSPIVENNTSCLSDDQKFTALVPPSGTGLTAAPYPTFFWYLPETLAQSLEFILRDENNLTVYSTRYSLLKSDGSRQSSPKIAHLTLPASTDTAPLEIGKEYHWELNLICNPNDRLQDIQVKANIKRIVPDATLNTSLQTASSTEKVALYANARLWHETVASFLALRRSNPNDPSLADAWTKLLNSVGLDNIAQNSWYVPTDF